MKENYVIDKIYSEKRTIEKIILNIGYYIIDEDRMEGDDVENGILSLER